MVSLKSLTLFLAFGLILCSALQMKKHAQSEEETKIPKDPKIQQTEAVGSDTGYEFDDWEPSLSQVAIITINSGSWIDGIIFQYKNGESSKKHGRQGGQNRRWTVPQGEHIKKVFFRAGDFIDSIQFQTNKGTKSPKWGHNGGEAKLLKIPEGYKIVGLFGGEGEFLDRLGFNIAPLQ